MARPPGKTCMHQGWSIDSLHPSRPILNIDNIISLVEQLPKRATDANFSAWKRDVETFLQANARKLLCDPLFREAPLSVVQTMLKLPALNVSEDELLQYIVQRVQGFSSRRTDPPCYWSIDEREKAIPIMKQLLPYIKILSLSTENFLRIVEPMNILDNEQLIQKYRYDALERHLKENDRFIQSHSFSTICEYYSDPETRISTLTQLRGTAVVTESMHPYDAGEAELIEEVCVGEWAPRMMIEFDRRTCIGEGAELTFYRDREANHIIETWHESWINPGKGVKSWLLDGCRVFVGFRSSFDAVPCWGWKLFAVPIFDTRDCDVV